ncbi:helix-turn-helix transcriptional regulator [Streptomyces sp. NPDC054887]
MVDEAQLPGNGFMLVGREVELGSILEALKDLPAVVLVEGESGCGKSRLLHEAERALSAKGVCMATGLCHPLREPFPYGPVLEAVSALAHRIPTGTVLPEWAGVLNLIPGFSAFFPNPPQTTGVELDRATLLQGIRAVLEVVRPVVLMVEDLHWADEATRELLFLLARKPPPGVGLVLTYRGEDLSPSQPVLGSPYRRPIGVAGAEINLRPLSLDDVTRLTGTVLGPVASRMLGPVLYRRSAGLPLIVEEGLLTLLERRGKAGPQNPGEEFAFLESSPVPRALEEAVHERLARLPDFAAHVVEAAAVLGVPATQEVLAEVAGLESAQSAVAITEALEKSLLHEAGSASYAFRHVLAQQAVYGRLPGPRRLHLHRRARLVLHAQQRPPLVQIAHHTRALGDTMGWLRDAEAAASQAIAMGDDGIATRLLQDILQEHDAGVEQRSRAAITLCTTAHRGTNWQNTLRLLRSLASDPDLSVRAHGWAHLTLSTMMTNQVGDREGAQLALERAIEELEPWPLDCAGAMATFVIHERTQPLAAIERWVERAESAIEGRDVGGYRDEGIVNAVAGNKLLVLSRAGDPHVWDRLASLRSSRTSPEVRKQVTAATYNVSVSGLHRGEDARAREGMEEVIRRVAEVSYPLIECFARTQLLRLDWLAGEWTNIEQRYDELDAEFPDMASVHRERTLTSGRIATSRGEWAKALECLAAATAAGARHGDVTGSLEAAAATADVHLARGDAEAAWTTVDPAVQLLRYSSAWPRAVGLVPTAVQAALLTGRRQEAERLVADAGRDAERERVAPAADAEIHFAHGLLAQDADPRAAAEHFHQARAMWQAIGRPYPTARATELYAQSIMTDQAQAATVAFAEAIDTCTRLGATWDAARCQQAAGQKASAHRSTRGRRGYGDTLSPREIDVARLLATGATNQDIAAALFLSVRTVEHHVARTLKKLGVTHRDEAAKLGTYSHQGHTHEADERRPPDAPRY